MPSRDETAEINQSDEASQTLQLNQWLNQGKAQLAELGLFDLRRGAVTNLPAQLPDSLSVVASVLLFLSTLAGQSVQTHKTYRVGCRRFMWFLHDSQQGDPAELHIADLSPLVLEDFYLWMVSVYGKKARTTMSNYLTSARNLFEYLARRRLTPQGCQYQEMVAGLAKLKGRESYRTPRVRTSQIEQIVKAVTQSAEQSVEQSVDGGSEAVSSVKHYTRQARMQTEKDRRQLEEARDRALILTLYTTGMRQQEVGSLNRGDVEPLIIDAGLSILLNPPTLATAVKTSDNKDLCKVDDGDISQSEKAPTTQEEPVYELIITGKGNKERVVYLDKFTLEAMAQYLALRGKDGYHPLFLQHHRGRAKVKPGPNGEKYRISSVTLWKVVSELAKGLGLQIHPHDFRHNLATTLLNAGAQLSEVQDILGHASPTTTKQIYAHYDKGHLKQAFSQYRKKADQLS